MAHQASTCPSCLRNGKAQASAASHSPLRLVLTARQRSSRHKLLRLVGVTRAHINTVVRVFAVLRTSLCATSLLTTYIKKAAWLFIYSNIVAARCAAEPYGLPVASIKDTATVIVGMTITLFRFIL